MNNTEARRNSNAFRFLFRKTFVYIAVIMGSLFLQSCNPFALLLLWPYEDFEKVQTPTQSVVRNCSDKSITLELWDLKTDQINMSFDIESGCDVTISQFETENVIQELWRRYENEPLLWLSNFVSGDTIVQENTKTVIRDANGVVLKTWLLNGDNLDDVSIYNIDNWHHHSGTPSNKEVINCHRFDWRDNMIENEIGD